MSYLLPTILVPVDFFLYIYYLGFPTKVFNNYNEYHSEFAEATPVPETPIDIDVPDH